MKTNRTQRTRWTYDEQDIVPELVTLGYEDTSQAIGLEEHLHMQSFEFVYIERGRAAWETQRETFETKAGDVFVAQPGEVHKGRFNIIEPCRLWWLIVQVPVAEGDGSDSGHAAAWDGVSAGHSHHAQTSSNQPYVIYPRRGLIPEQSAGWLQLQPEEQRWMLEKLWLLPRVHYAGPEAARSFHRLQQVLSHAGPMAPLEGRLILTDLLLFMIRQAAAAEDARQRLAKESLARIVQLLHSQPDWQPTVPELAKEAGMGTTHFYRSFQAYTGLTPKGYIEHRRMEEACRLLEQSDRSIMDISLDLGFATSQHFATVFRRKMGRTPTEWRRERGRSEV
ncbi:helix-turn-helix domain-containing protein [Paenibacillus sp. GCM10023252]|uniref:helix-turn-helix domain-containing protein n=1 Tax=Paenibacillus sp. GCM10023252 TaxID=3252649 RepID=UPI003619F4DD